MSWTAALLERKENPPSYPKEPSKLHMVELVQTTRGQPKWDKGYIKQLGFGEEPKLNTRIILKNTENTNTILKKVKHLLRITPITFPYGPPDENCDPDKCYLRDNGEFVVVRDITPKEEIPLLAERDDSVWTMDKETLDKHTRKTVQNYRLNNEYFKEEPVYEMNQDGKEHRYFGNKRMYGQDTWY
ncbi:hypothetical protein FSP39_025498 [Pinctada imbricata]|uniref:39S ribosomal protein L30, mitochondrial n=1 Tax=Pinctada imbricata TaxID=66713 RepID=A0AA89C4K2_PINIB|nr:hypothetical protein FSP39_025498 [Pinctada imbricata]